MMRTAWHSLMHLLGVDAADSQTTQPERAALAQYSAGRSRLLEIGVFEGVTASILARSMAPNGVLFAIDPFLPGRIGICWGRLIANREIARTRRRGAVRFVRRYSFQATDEVEGTFDFIFIDGDHSLDGITQDWHDWSHRVIPGGVVALHDTRVPNHDPGVADYGSYRYFESEIRHDARFRLVEQVDSLSILVRRDLERTHESL